MKKLILLAIIILTASTPLFAQNLVTQRKIAFFTDYVDRFNTNEIYDINSPDIYQGSPYYNNSFLLGNVYYNNELLQKNIALRFNVFADEMEFKKSIADADSEAQAIVKSQDIFVTINGVAFVFLPSKGYFEVIYDGINFSYIKKVAKKYYPARPPANSYDQGALATFQDKETFFLYTKEGMIYEFPKSKSKKLKVFGDSQKEVNKYIKENKLDINKEKDLKRVVMYLDGLENATL